MHTLILIFFLFISFVGVTSAPIVTNLLLHRTPNTVITDPFATDREAWGNVGSADVAISGTCGAAELADDDDGLFCRTVLGNNQSPCAESGGSTNNRFADDILASNFGFNSPSGSEGSLPPYGVTINNVQVNVWKQSYTINDTVNAIYIPESVTFQGNSKIFDYHVQLQIAGQNSSDANAWRFIYDEAERFPAPPVILRVPMRQKNPDIWWGLSSGLFTPANLRSSTLGFKYSMYQESACGSNNPSNNFKDGIEPFNRIAVVDKIEMVIDATITHSLISISPIEGPSSSSSEVVTLTGTGFAPSASEICVFIFTSGEQLLAPATIINPTTATCTVPENYGNTGNVAVGLSLDGGLSYSDNGASTLYSYTIPCGSVNCSYPAGGNCDRFTGICGCNPGYWGTDCDQNCFDLSGYSCGSCSARPVDKCDFCLETMKCGQCEHVGGNPTDPAINFTTGLCPSIFNVVPLNLSIADESGHFAELNTSNLNSTVTFNCKWGALGTTPATQVNATFWKCEIPIHSQVTFGNIETIQLSFDRVGQEYVPEKYSFTYGILNKQPGKTKFISGETGSDAGIIAAVIAAGSVICFGSAVSYARYRKKLANDKFRALFAPPVFSIFSAFENYYSIHSSLEHEVLQDSNGDWAKVRELLLAPDFKFLDAYVSCFEDHSTNDLVRAILYLFDSSNKSVEVINHYIDLETKIAESPQTLFRGSNPASKLWSAFVQTQMGLTYMHSTLAHPLYSICSTFGETSLELNPDLLGEGESIATNKYHLMSSCQQLFEAITDANSDIPLKMRSVLIHLRHKVTDRYPDFALKIVGAFIFLRYWCPAVATPLSYGLLKTEPEDNARKLLLLVSKTLINLANGVEFGVKQTYMQVLNDFLNSNLEKCADYYFAVSSKPDSETGEFEDDENIENLETEAPSEEIDDDVIAVSLVLLVNFMINDRVSIEKAIQTQCTGGVVQDLQSSLAEIINVFAEPFDIDIELDDL